MASNDEGRNQPELRFHRLYQANFRPVQAYTVNRLGPVDEVADVVAETFMTAWRRLADIPPPPNPGYSRRTGRLDLLIANESEKCLLSAIMRLSRFTVPRMERHLSRGFYGVVEGAGR
jgi:hypothetical protein